MAKGQNAVKIADLEVQQATTMTAMNTGIQRADGLDRRVEWVEYKQEKWEKSRNWVLEGFPSIEKRYYDNVINVEDRDYAAVKRHLPADMLKDLCERLLIPEDKNRLHGPGM